MFNKYDEMFYYGVNKVVVEILFSGVEGNEAVDKVKAFKEERALLPKEFIELLKGSTRQEIEDMFKKLENSTKSVFEWEDQKLNKAMEESQDEWNIGKIGQPEKQSLLQRIRILEEKRQELLGLQ